MSELEDIIALFQRLGFPLGSERRDWSTAECLWLPNEAEQEILLDTGWSLWFTEDGTFLGSYHNEFGTKEWDEAEPQWQPRGYEARQQAALTARDQSTRE